jgi:hypothetical protein
MNEEGRTDDGSKDSKREQAANDTEEPVQRMVVLGRNLTGDNDVL